MRLVRHSLGLISACVLWSGVVAAQAPRQTATPPPAGNAPAPAEESGEELPGARGPLPDSMDSIAKAVETPYRPKPGGHRIKFNLEDADLAELVNHISGLTGRRFIYGSKVRKINITVVSPTPVTLAEAYEAFLSILQTNGMTVVPSGEFLKIVDTAGVVQELPPLYSRATPVPNTDGYVTRLYRLKSASPAEVSKLITRFKSKEGDVTVYDPSGLLIITDTGNHVNRLIRMIEEVDVGSATSRMWIEPIHYGDARDFATQINEIFSIDPASAGGLTRVIADEQTNSLIIVGSQDSYLKLLEFLKRVDTAPAAEGRIHVLPLQHAVAEELAQTLSRMMTGGGAAPPAAGGRRGAAAAPAAAAGGDAGLFEGTVRITADKATNSLVVTSSSRDYAQLRMVIDQLDRERRQVFIEAVIMDLSADRGNTFGLSYHGGATVPLFGEEDSIILGGFNALNSIAGPTDLQALALGVRGPDLAGTEGRIPNLPAGVSIPAFGVTLNAIASSADSNVLSTPHIIAMDNTEAEINVGDNIPLQTNFAGGGNNLSSIAGLLGNQAGATGTPNLAALGSLGSLGFNAPRQDVGTKIKITPHINERNKVRLEIQEEISEQGATSGQLGAVSITQRSAKTTVMVDDQQTVVIGGLMRDTKMTQHQKIPVLGDLPVLGFLFRNSTTQMKKTNLLLILTPYVIQSQEDLRKIFTRKMRERQEFLDRYFVFTQDWKPPMDYTRTTGLVERIRQAYAELDERKRLELESRPGDVQVHEPSEPLDLPVDSVKPKGAAPAPAPAPAPATPPRRQRSELTPAQPQRGGEGTPNVPLVINPVARSVRVDRVE
jgi:general secretion pathway protein D